MKKVILLIVVVLIASFSFMAYSQTIKRDSNTLSIPFKKSFYNSNYGVCLISYQDVIDTILNEEEYSIIDSQMNRTVYTLGNKSKSKLDTNYLRYNVVAKCYYINEEQIKYLDKRIKIINNYINRKFDLEITEISKERNFDLFIPSEDSGGYLIITVKLYNARDY